MIIFTLKSLIKHNVHIGHYKWECDYRLSYLLLGIRNSIHIINIYNSLYVLKRILYIIYNLGIINQRVLIINNVNFEIESFLDNLNKNKIWYISKKWIGGLLTNQKQIYVYNENLFKKFYNVGYKSILPSFVFTSNIENSGSSIFESIILNIPNSALVDSNMGYYGIFYKLSSNDDNYVVMNLFSKIFAKTYIKSIIDKKKNLIKRNENKKKKKIYIKELLLKKKYIKNFKDYLLNKREEKKKKIKKKKVSKKRHIEKEKKKKRKNNYYKHKQKNNYFLKFKQKKKFKL